MQFQSTVIHYRNKHIVSPEYIIIEYYHTGIPNTLNQCFF